MQVAAAINTTAVANKIQDAQPGTPNLLLQTDLDIVPSVSFQPATLPHAVLYSGTPAAARLQQLNVINSQNTSVDYQVICLMVLHVTKWVA